MQYYSQEYFDELKNIVIRFAFQNYDLYYLKTMHQLNREEGAAVIATGSSYGQIGLEMGRFHASGGMINFSMSGQDLFFDYMQIKKAVREGKRKIETCLLCLGYYALYQDLSLSTNVGRSIPNVLYPVLGELHHWPSSKPLVPLFDWEFDRSLFPEEAVLPLCEQWITGFFRQERSYFGSIRKRERINRYVINHDRPWSEASAEEQEQEGMRRAAEHNRQMKYTASREENIAILKEMMAFLEENEIRPIVVFMPFTKVYLKYLDPCMKEELMETLIKSSSSVEIMDFNEMGIVFPGEMFQDTDHLTLAGAEIVSDGLNDLVCREG